MDDVMGKAISFSVSMVAPVVMGTMALNMLPDLALKFASMIYKQGDFVDTLVHSSQVVPVIQTLGVLYALLGGCLGLVIGAVIMLLAQPTRANEKPKREQYRLTDDGEFEEVE